MAGLITWGPATLRATFDLTPDVRLFAIDPPPGHVPPEPGSHVHVLVQIGERQDVRSYSTIPAAGAGLPDDGQCRIAVKRLPDSRGGSAYLWGLRPGARLTMSLPRNRFALGRGRPEYLLVAGGIGITPLVGMALALARADATFRLLYGVRSPADAAFADELRAHIGDRLALFAGAPIDLPGEIARLAPGGELYVCGPIGMLEAAKRAWRDAGRPMADLRFETFGNSGRFAAEPFVVRIPRLGIEVEVPRTATLLETLERAGVEAMYDCRRGECGLCALPILAVDGIVDHRDVFFSDEEKATNARLCACVSRVAGGSITLDTGDRAR